MDTPNEMLDFVKALSDADRLRVIGLLTHGPLSLTQIAPAVGIPPAEALRHLDHLVHAGILSLSDGLYELDNKSLEKLARRQFEGGRESYLPAPDLNDAARGVLSAHLNSDGTVKQIPAQPAKLKVILDYVVNAFTPGTVYSEKEVNMIIRRFHIDVSGLRRDLVDAGMLRRERDGSRYWRQA